MSNKDRNHPLFASWTRRDFLVRTGAASALALLGCGKEQKAAPSGSGQVDAAAKGLPWEKTILLAGLHDMVHMADIHYFGQFVDFGTAARFKYTLGDWMTGWANDGTLNGVSYTWASAQPSRLYFNLDAQEAVTFEFRVKPGGTDTFSVYLNDHPLTRVKMTERGFATYRVEAAAEHTVPGENYLKLMYATAEQKVAGKPASFAVDYLRIIPASAKEPKRFDPPYGHRLVQRIAVDKVELDALVFPAEMTARYYLTVPDKGALCMRAATLPDAAGKYPNGEVTVSVLPVSGGKPVQVARREVRGKWTPVMADLSRWAGQLVRLDVRAAGARETRLALGDPAIRVAPVAVASKDKAKNVVVLLVDTLRADKLRVYGNKRVKTDGMAAFAQDATVFENCQANSNWTKPSCASVLTGLHPDSHKARGHSSRVGRSVKLASEVFRAKGFATGAFIANGYLAAEFGFNRGWSTYVNYIRENKNSDAENVFADALKFIEQVGDKPFFTYIQTIDPHVPYDPPAEDLKLYDARPYEGPVQPRSTGNLLEDFKRKRVTLNARDKMRLEALYNGEVTYHDRQFNKFVSALKKKGVLDDTVFVICSDHGEEFFEHESVGHGHTLYQELLHVPLIVRGPGYPKGKRVAAMASLSDVLPTVLDAVGHQPEPHMEGRVLRAVAHGAPAYPFDAAFSSFYSEADERNLQWAVRQGEWKMRMRGPVNTYVYRLSEDPQERVDVDERYPEARRALRIALGQFIGAPEKQHWWRGLVRSEVLGKPEAKEEKNSELPEDLKQQLRQLGYIQ